LGKNLALRFSVAIIGIPALIYICILGGYFLLALTILLAAIGGAEINFMLRARGYKASLFFSVLLPVLFVVGVFHNFPVIHLLTLTVFIHLIMIAVEYSRNEGGDLSQFLGDFFGRLLPVFYVALLASYIIWLDESTDKGGLFIILVFLIVWATDTAAYFGGLTTGRHKLSPTISPKKTLEGFLFGFIGALIAGVFSELVFLDLGWPRIIVISLAACLMGQLGDLFESAIKRHCGVKDSSSILPGHGGLLDRFDSFLFAIPAVYFIVMIWR
jgi:phosphatidate cytidylyltransferase